METILTFDPIFHAVASPVHSQMLVPGQMAEWMRMTWWYFVDWLHLTLFFLTCMPSRSSSKALAGRKCHLKHEEKRFHSKHHFQTNVFLEKCCSREQWGRPGCTSYVSLEAGLLCMLVTTEANTHTGCLALGFHNWPVPVVEAWACVFFPQFSCEHSCHRRLLLPGACSTQQNSWIPSCLWVSRSSLMKTLTCVGF